eukprot:Gregarina_sp_Poly_1__4188@NODE_2291_length_2354_cov_35_724093_g1467_i0_p2_GENE_NODE_2291_length_2354_cov_35_724093_g1467_i0NODE_2291_length_2354_cov_35_724093_g1467_i0_p2_ORF_typecomplete_len278_score24_21_NODE_2291_length_2354_cov_35_724093_g1467_i01811014
MDRLFRGIFQEKINLSTENCAAHRFLLKNHSHEMFHRLRTELCSWSDEEQQHFYGMIIQALAWSLPDIIKISTRCPKYIRSVSDLFEFFDPDATQQITGKPLRCRSPLAWYEMEVIHKAIDWVSARGSKPEVVAYPIPLHEWTSGHAKKTLTLMIKRSHSSPDMQAKWLFHYVATINGAAELGQEESTSTEEGALDLYERFSNPLEGSKVVHNPIGLLQDAREIKLQYSAFWNSDVLKGKVTKEEDISPILPVCSRPAYHELPTSDLLPTSQLQSKE